MSKLKIYPLDHLAVTGLCGSDALTFLQGQGTQDYRRLADTPVLAGAFCNAKGRVVSNVWNVLLHQDPAELKLITHLSSAPLLQQHLNKYIPFFRGSRLTDERLLYHGVGVSGAVVGDFLSGLLNQKNADIWSENGHFAFRLPDGRAQYWLDVQADDYEARLAELEQLDVQPAAEWCKLDIESGYAWVEAGQHLSFIPQMLNLEALDGISFNKGCYTGQEVVARLHYKGQSKRNLTALAWTGQAEPVAAGPYNDKAQSGEWVNWIREGNGGVGLAVIKSSDLESGLFLDEDRRHPLKLLHS